MKLFQISDKINNVSRIGIGCMRITGLSDEKAVRSLTEGALECGINFLIMQIFMQAEKPKRDMEMR